MTQHSFCVYLWFERFVKDSCADLVLDVEAITQASAIMQVLRARRLALVDTILVTVPGADRGMYRHVVSLMPDGSGIRWEVR